MLQRSSSLITLLILGGLLLTACANAAQAINASGGVTSTSVAVEPEPTNTEPLPVPTETEPEPATPTPELEEPTADLTESSATPTQPPEDKAPRGATRAR